MTDTFTIDDIDFDATDPSDWYIEIRAISSDGTSEDHTVADPNDLKRVLVELKACQDGDHLAKLTQEQRDRYDRFTTESECQCDGSCTNICWYDLQDRDRWLNKVAPDGVDIEWVWMFGELVAGPRGSGYLSEFNTVIDEGPGLAGEIWGQVDWD